MTFHCFLFILQTEKNDIQCNAHEKKVKKKEFVYHLESPIVTFSTFGVSLND